MEIASPCYGANKWWAVGTHDDYIGSRRKVSTWPPAAAAYSDGTGSSKRQAAQPVLDTAIRFPLTLNYPRDRQDLGAHMRPCGLPQCPQNTDRPLRTAAWARLCICGQVRTHRGQPQPAPLHPEAHYWIVIKHKTSKLRIIQYGVRYWVQSIKLQVLSCF